MYWATRVSNIGFQMALPALLGWWADTYFKTGPWLLISGAVLGFLSGMVAIFQLAKALDTKPGSRQQSSDPPH
jgi:F0F1-type ATP synthase assembly protein I